MFQSNVGRELKHSRDLVTEVFQGHLVVKERILERYDVNWNHVQRSGVNGCNGQVVQNPVERIFKNREDGYARIDQIQVYVWAAIQNTRCATCLSANFGVIGKIKDLVQKHVEEGHFIKYGNALHSLLRRYALDQKPKVYDVIPCRVQDGIIGVSGITV